MTNSCMTFEDDFVDFSTTLQSTSTLIYKQTLPGEVLLIYFNALAQKMNLQQFKVALSAHLADEDRCPFFPKPGEIISQHKSIAGTAGREAWMRVINAVRLIGKNRSVTFDDPRIHVVIQSMGGWVHLCETLKVDDFKAMHQFTEAIDALPAVLPNAPTKLVGLSEAVNTSNGVKVTTLPVRVPSLENAAMRTLPMLTSA